MKISKTLISFPSDNIYKSIKNYKINTKLFDLILKKKFCEDAVVESENINTKALFSFKLNYTALKLNSTATCITPKGRCIVLNYSSYKTIFIVELKKTPYLCMKIPSKNLLAVFSITPLKLRSNIYSLTNQTKISLKDTPNEFFYINLVKLNFKKTELKKLNLNLYSDFLKEHKLNNCNLEENINLIAAWTIFV